MLQIVDNPLLHPGECYCCRSAGRDGRKFVDTGKRLPGRGGILYICETCIGNIAKLFGWENVSEFKQAIELLEELKNKLERENDQLRSSLSTLVDLKSLFADSSSGGTEDKEQSTKPVSKSKQPVKAAKSGSAKSSNGARLQDVLSDDETADTEFSI